LRKRKRRSRPISIAALRVHDLGRVFTWRYGEILPDDDAGRGDVQIIAHHLAKLSGDPAWRISDWIALRASWMDDTEADDLIARVLAKPLNWRADTLAKKLGLTAAERRQLHITTIGAIDESRKQRIAARRERDRIRKAEKRRERGSVPRAIYEKSSATRTKPWQSLQMSRTAWYRAGKPIARAA
jgi:hypothetical protein